MSKKENIVYNLCHQNIPYETISGNMMKRGCKYIRVELRNTIELPEEKHCGRYDEEYDERYDEEAQTLDICPYCIDRIIKQSKKARKWRTKKRAVQHMAESARQKLSKD